MRRAQARHALSIYLSMLWHVGRNSDQITVSEWCPAAAYFLTSILSSIHPWSSPWLGRSTLWRSEEVQRCQCQSLSLRLSFRLRLPFILSHCRSNLRVVVLHRLYPNMPQHRGAVSAISLSVVFIGINWLLLEYPHSLNSGYYTIIFYNINIFEYLHSSPGAAYCYYFPVAEASRYYSDESDHLEDN